MEPAHPIAAFVGEEIVTFTKGFLDADDTEEGLGIPGLGEANQARTRQTSK